MEEQSIILSITVEQAELIRDSISHMKSAICPSEYRHIRLEKRTQKYIDKYVSPLERQLDIKINNVKKAGITIENARKKTKGLVEIYIDEKKMRSELKKKQNIICITENSYIAYLYVAMRMNGTSKAKIIKQIME